MVKKYQTEFHNAETKYKVTMVAMIFENSCGENGRCGQQFKAASTVKIHQFVLEIFDHSSLANFEPCITHVQNEEFSQKQSNQLHKYLKLPSNKFANNDQHKQICFTVVDARYLLLESSGALKAYDLQIDQLLAMVQVKCQTDHSQTIQTALIKHKIQKNVQMMGYALQKCSLSSLNEAIGIHKSMICGYGSIVLCKWIKQSQDEPRTALLLHDLAQNTALQLNLPQQFIPNHPMQIIDCNCKLILIANKSCLYIFQVAGGDCLQKIDLNEILLHHSQIQINEQEQLSLDIQEEGRIEQTNQKVIQKPEEQKHYVMLFDQLHSNHLFSLDPPIHPKLHQTTQVFLLHQTKMILYKIDTGYIINQYLVSSLNQMISDIMEDKQTTHESVTKTLNFRTKMMKTLRDYMIEGGKVSSYGSCMRLLENEQSLSILNDGVEMLYRKICGELKLSIKDRPKELVHLGIIVDRELVKLCQRLILSKYETHIATGLTILLDIYKLFKQNELKQTYNTIMEHARITKILKQSKKKRLFELAYELVLLVKGYHYLENII